MKRLSFLISALMCAGMMVFADPVASEYCGYEGDETKSGDAYITLSWETLSNGDVQIILGPGTNATSASFRNGGFEGGIEAFVVSTDNFTTTTPASNYFTAEKVYSGNVFTLVKIADVPANAKIKHQGQVDGNDKHAMAWKVNGKDAWSFPDFIYTYGSACQETPVLTKIYVTVADPYAKVGEEIPLTVQAIDQLGRPMDVEITFEVSPADMGTFKDNVFTFSKVGTATIVAKSGSVSGTVVVYAIAPTLTRMELTTSKSFGKIGDEITLTTKAFDQLDKPMDVAITYEVSPSNMGSIKDNVFTFAKLGAATITAKSGEVTASVTIHGVPSDNIAEGKTSEAGYNPENMSEQANAANDGKDNTAWVTWADRPTTEEWWYVDLGAKYDVVGVDVLWGADYSTNYILQIRSEAPSDADKADDEAWTTVATVTDAAKNSAKYSAFMEEARYIRLHSLAKSAAQCIRLREVSVFGTEWKPKDDTEKPVMVSATVFSKTWNSVVISVEATDNYGVKKYHVVDAKHAIDTLILPIDEKISIPDLLPSTEYTFTITAVDIVALESDNSKNVTFTTEEHLTAPKVAVADPTWPEGQVKAFYSDTYTPFCEWNYNAGWGQSTQLKEEEIGGNHMLHYTNMNWLGWVLLSGNPYNVLTMEKFHIDIWAEEDGKLKLTPIFGGEGKTTDDGKGVFVDVIGQQWNSYDIALTDFNGLDLTSIFQFKISDGTLTEFFVDNAYFYRTTELKDELKPTNLQASVAEQGYFSVTLNLSAEDNFGVVNFVVKDGEKEVAAGGGVSGKEVKVVVANLKPNTDYTFAVIAKDESNNETDPFEVTAKTLAAPAAAPKPNFGEKKVAAVFCDAIEGGPAITIGNWSQTTIASSIELAEGDHAFYLQKTNYLGWELAPAVKAGDLEFLHVDFYSKDMTSISLTPISPGKEGSYTVQLKANEWVSTDIPLSAFAAAGIAWDNIFQFKFMNATPEGKELFIDNVYFHTKKAEGIEGIQNTEYSVQKVLRNGQVIILRGDKKYSITGQAIQ